MLHDRIPHGQSPHQPFPALLVQYEYRTLLLFIGAVSQAVLQRENLPHQIQPEFLCSFFPAAAFNCALVATQQIIGTGKILHFISFPAVLTDTTALAGIVTAPICRKKRKDASSFPAHVSPAVGAAASEKRADTPVGVAIGRIVVVGIAIVVGIAEPTTGSNRNQLTPC